MRQVQGRLFEIASQIESDRKSVLMVGHGPGFEEFVEAVTGRLKDFQPEPW